MKEEWKSAKFIFNDGGRELSDISIKYILGLPVRKQIDLKLI